MYPTPSAPSGGVFVAREVHALQSVGVDVEVVHVDTVARTSLYWFGRHIVRGAVEAYGPDLIHIHYGLSQLLTFPIPIPTVCTFHGSDLNVPWQRSISTMLARRLDHAIVVSPSLAARVPRSVPTTVIPCSVQVESLPSVDRATARARLGLPRDGILLAFPGSPQKSIKRYDRFRTVVSLVDGAEELVLSGLDPSEVPLWLTAADCLVITSDAEGSPVVSKEALCCGTKVVSTPVGDIAEQTLGLTGCAVSRSFDPSAIAEEVIRVLGTDGPDRRIALDRFNISREAEQVLEVYRGVVGT